ncbi:SMC-Scp complex subunit ScpB [Phytohalomonas tamaricis]|uniref:SMC-Scp complex subunit ScpB n=1 Tax=Phytohalomonas tamaricis TaxID=2081032 RepID=UPI000D0BDEBD|nr:SMC-Scp complex subunit ScpB [Phytohalomonas tamaricis]
MPVRPSLEHILEGVLLACEEPLSLERLEGLFDEHERPLRRELKETLVVLGERLDGTALELQETASGYRLRIRAALSPWVSRLWEERPQRYSRALLETLALIAYRQPVTRGDIEDVRGVSISASIMRTLGERGWIRVIGHRDVPGRPAVYATTRTFLDDFGLKTLDELPPMHELKQGDTFDWLEQSNDSTATAADTNAEHAGKASSRQRDLSFTELGERLAARARRESAEDSASEADDATDRAADADIPLDDEISPDS